MNNSKQQHLDWCRQRALQYLDAGELTNACASLLSDLRKHEETRTTAALAGEQWAAKALSGHWDNPENVRQLIDQFCPEAN